MDNTKNLLNEDTLRLIEWRAINEERKNVKSHEKKDAEMVDILVKIVKEEVDRITR